MAFRCVEARSQTDAAQAKNERHIVLAEGRDLETNPF